MDESADRQVSNYYSRFKASSAGLHLSDIPQDFSEITGRPHSKLWLEAVDSELKSMDLNKVWNIVPILPIRLIVST